MKIKSRKISRLVCGITAALFTLGLAVPAMIASESAFAATMTSSSIAMSSSAPGASASYQVGFTPATSATIQGIVVDFCSNDAIASDSCTAPTGFTVGSPTVATSGGSNTGLTGSWTAGSLNSGRTLTLTNSTGTALTSSTPVVFTLSTATNPTSAAGPFYARILTYTTTAGATGYSAPATVGFTDTSGVAMSTANVITVTARVMPTLQFCVSAAAPTSNCGGTSSPNIIIGHGPASIIDSTAIDTNSVYSQLSTNAVSGAVIKATISTPVACGGLQSLAGNCIDPNSSSPAAMTAGTAGFGMTVLDGTGGTGSVTSSTNYNPVSPHNTTCASADRFALNKTNMTGTYGDQMASSTGPVNNVNNQYCFAATASNTTPSGIYTANIDLIATGTF